MKIIYNKWIPVKGFTAINIFGLICARKEKKPLSPETIHHELIHTAQIRETLFVPFYIIYGIHFVILLVKKRHWLEAYRNVCFEKEAYYFECEKRYLECRNPYCWITYL